MPSNLQTRVIRWPCDVFFRMAAVVVIFSPLSQGAQCAFIPRLSPHLLYGAGYKAHSLSYHPLLSATQIPRLNNCRASHLADIALWPPVPTRRHWSSPYLLATRPPRRSNPYPSSLDLVHTLPDIVFSVFSNRLTFETSTPEAVSHTRCCNPVGGDMHMTCGELYRGHLHSLDGTEKFCLLKFRHHRPCQIIWPLLRQRFFRRCSGQYS